MFAGKDIPNNHLPVRHLRGGLDEHTYQNPPQPPDNISFYKTEYPHNNQKYPETVAEHRGDARSPLQVVFDSPQYRPQYSAAVQRKSRHKVEDRKNNIQPGKINYYRTDRRREHIFGRMIDAKQNPSQHNA